MYTLRLNTQNLAEIVSNRPRVSPDHDIKEVRSQMLLLHHEIQALFSSIKTHFQDFTHPGEDADNGFEPVRNAAETWKKEQPVFSP
ncbi:MAG: hypothetical protein OS130_00635 [Thermodesulfobacteriota bacterium]|nr:MAG: hypothetical protein OS130_00635 [Thermodesulfobacteriota bacterium]